MTVPECRWQAVSGHDRYCTAIVDIADEDVREATDSEIKKLPPCAWCG